MIIDLYSKRKRAKERPADDVFEYDTVPQALRVQIIQMFEEAISAYNSYSVASNKFEISPDLLEAIVKGLRREYGLRTLVSIGFSDRYQRELLSFIEHCETDEFLDCVELYCNIIAGESHLDGRVRNQLIHEVNYRFRQAEFGYEYDKEIIRIDSKLVHGDVVKPVIKLLSDDPVFAGAESEFFSAFSHYKEGKHKEAIADALKSLESTMKAILTKREWKFSQTDTASKLIHVCLENELIPPYLQTQFTSLKSLLEAGVPTIRNKTSGHGQGVSVQIPSDHLTSFTLYMAAINIKFLIDCDAAKP